MYCYKCGKELKDGNKFCEYCGAQVYSAENPAAPRTAEILTPATTSGSNPNASNGFAIAGLICSFLFSLLGLIFGIIGLSKAKTIGKGKVMSIIAIIVSCLMFVLNIIILY